MSANQERHLCLGEGDCLAPYCSHSRLKFYFLTTFSMYIALKEFNIKFRPYMNYSYSGTFTVNAKCTPYSSSKIYKVELRIALFLM